MKILKSKITVVLLFLFLASHTNAQVNPDEVLMTIGGKSIYVSEFLNIYQKNNAKGENIDKKSLNEYVDLFINFKLKVKQAEELGLDTLTSFRNELNGYRDQLAKPYFTDEATIDRLVTEAYERQKFDNRASHIYFKLSPDAAPQDSLATYNKAIKIRDKYIKGETFEALAVEYSEDPSAKDREANQQHPFLKGNRGDLGYFTVFDMVYPFENGAYNTEVGKVSMPVRTDYGYHLIKVVDKRPALGKITVAHIFVSIPKNATSADSARVKTRIDSAYMKLTAGTPFEELVKQYSDDKGSAAKGGVLPSFGVNRMVPEFIDAIYGLQTIGEYSKPILTPYGWHIVKLVDRKTQKPFDEEKAELKQKVMKDSRGEASRQVILERIRKENPVITNNESLEAFYTLVTDSIFIGKWTVNPDAQLNLELLKINDQTFTQKDFAGFLASKQHRREKENIRIFVDKMYGDYVDDCLLKYENAHLEQKYPEFRALMNEYRDGILLFDLTDQKVWSKAVKDTVGLKEFYLKNKNNYKWDTRVNASIYTVKDTAWVLKIRNYAKAGMSDEDILDTLPSERNRTGIGVEFKNDIVVKTTNYDSLKILNIESGKFSRKDNKIIDTVAWTPGLSKNLRMEGSTVFVYIRKVLKPELKELNEARGLITADYQNYLEKEWIQSLREKYPVVLNKEVLDKIN